MSSFVMFILALLPIIWLVAALCGLHMQAHIAAAGAFAISAVCATTIWHMPLINCTTAALEGFAMAIWPIVIVIIAAVFTYNLTVHTQAMETIKQQLTSVSSDKRVLTLLIAWCFGAFLEGMAGFGTAVAIPASMLYALGIDPIVAIICCLVANGVPTMFGSIGIPTTTLAAITHVNVFELSLMQALQVAPFTILCPFIITTIVGDGRKALKGVVPIILVSGLSFSISSIFAAYFIGAELADIVGSVISLISTFIFALKTSGNEVPTEYRLDIKKATNKITADVALRAWSPFILIFVVLLLTSKLIPQINEPLSQFKSTVNIYAGDPQATLTFMWVNTPGVLILLSGVIGGIIQHATLSDMLDVFKATCKQMSKTVLTMLGVLGVAKIMGYSGMIASIAAFFVGTLGALYPLVAPLLGALGTFVTGSGTSSEVLFGNVQLQAAAEIGVNKTWLVASNSLGISAGKMISPQNIAIGCAACGLVEKDGEILSGVAKYSFLFMVLMSIMVYVGASLI